MIYLDNQATTACDPRVYAAMQPFFEAEYGNPHSAGHDLGRRAADAVETARAEVAALIGADPREIVFTSGATEANNLAIKGVARHAARMGDPRRRIVTVATEHPCVLESALALRGEGFDVVLLPVGCDGLVDLRALDVALAAAPTLLVSVMAAHNETGVLQDTGAIAARAHAAGALLHTDAAQAAGKIPLDAGDLDLVSISGHKMYGPKGIGALRVRRRPRVRLEPLFSGGGQERGLRSGTLPVPLVVGLGAACRIAADGMAAEAARRVRAARPAAGAAARGDPRPGGEWQPRPSAARQPQPPLPRPARDGAAGRLPRARGLHRFGLRVGRDRALAHPARDGAGTRGGRRVLAPLGGTLYLRARDRLRGGAPDVCLAAQRPHRHTHRGRSRMPIMTFINRDGSRRQVDAPLGHSLLEIAHANDIDVEGACEGSLACATCHVIVDPAWYGKLARPTPDEDDMLDLAVGLTKRSRLGCQVVMTAELDGLVVAPAARLNARARRHVGGVWTAPWWRGCCTRAATR